MIAFNNTPSKQTRRDRVHSDSEGTLFEAHRKRGESFKVADEVKLQSCGCVLLSSNASLRGGDETLEEEIQRARSTSSKGLDVKGLTTGSVSQHDVP